jgi:hypothetical protein
MACFTNDNNIFIIYIRTSDVPGTAAFSRRPDARISMQVFLPPKCPNKNSITVSISRTCGRNKGAHSLDVKGGREGIGGIYEG